MFDITKQQFVKTYLKSKTDLSIKKINLLVSILNPTYKAFELSDIEKFLSKHINEANNFLIFFNSIKKFSKQASKTYSERLAKKAQEKLDRERDEYQQKRYIRLQRIKKLVLDNSNKVINDILVETKFDNIKHFVNCNIKGVATILSQGNDCVPVSYNKTYIQGNDIRQYPGFYKIYQIHCLNESEYNLLSFWSDEYSKINSKTKTYNNFKCVVDSILSHTDYTKGFGTYDFKHLKSSVVQTFLSDGTISTKQLYQKCSLTFKECIEELRLYIELPNIF